MRRASLSDGYEKYYVNVDMLIKDCFSIAFQIFFSFLCRRSFFATFVIAFMSIITCYFKGAMFNHTVKKTPCGITISKVDNTRTTREIVKLLQLK